MRSSFYWPGLVVAAASSSKASLLFPTQKNISLLTVSSRLPPLLRTQTTAYIRRTFSRSFSFRVAGGLLPSSTRRPLAIVAKGSASVGSTASNSSNKNSKMGGQTGHASSLPAEANFTRTIHTAACLIIGDEVLGGKTVDTNSAFLAKFCFKLGITLKRIEVIEDDEKEIVEAARRMSEKYDFVVTSGGIGPTHDDITYQSLANAFSLPLVLNEPSFERMKRLMRAHPSQPNFDWEDKNNPALAARLRMVTLPWDESRPGESQALFPSDDLWVPVAVVNGNIYVLPGVPKLFQKLVDSLESHLRPRLVDPEGEGTTRVLISTPMAESLVAGYLTELAGRVADRGVKVGSYPRWEKKTNTITLVGKNREFLESLVPEVAERVQGRRIAVEGEDDEIPTAYDVAKFEASEKSEKKL